ncbi:MAG: hydantoinase/oxoprolinase family protein, partial [Gammaproteobacteria bacterium]
LTQAWPVIIPPGPGVLCAYGDATTQVRDEASLSYLRRLDSLTVAELLADLERLRARAAESLDADGIALAEQEIEYEADLRYAGQAFQLTLRFAASELESAGAALLSERFDREHEQLFTFALGEGHEIVMLRAVVKQRARALPVLKLGREGTTLEEAKIHDTRIYHSGVWHAAPIYDRNLLHEGLVVPGPAIVQEMDSTTLLLPGHAARIDAVGNLLIEPAGRA